MASGDGPQGQDAGEDRQQLVQQCLERVEASATAQRELLQRGLVFSSELLDPLRRQQDPQGPPGSSRDGPPHGGPSPRHGARTARLRLLQHLERLDTAIALNNGAWNPAAFSSLRDCTVVEAATELAAAGRLAVLPLLLQRHPRALLPSALDVLAAVPETLDPKRYSQLIRQVASLQQPPPLERAADWVESAETAAELRDAGEYALLLATEPMCEASLGWHPPTQRQLAAWVCERAQHLDATTGQLVHAITLLEAAQAALHFGEAAISGLLASAQELLSLVKLATSRQEVAGSTWRTELRQYAALGPQQRLALLLGLVGSGDGLASDLSLQVAPFLARLRSGSSSNGEGALDPQVVLRQALEREAAQRLAWVVRLVQCESRQLAAFSSASQLSKTAAACCYACEATDAWELLSSLLKAGQEAVRVAEELGPEDQQAAEDALDTVRGHVTAARLLTKHGLTTPLSAVRDADQAAALRTLRTLLARVSRTKNTESRWVDVWMDLRTIRERGLPQLSEDEVRTEFCRALLRVGQYRLCKSYLQGLRPEAAEQLVLAAGREVFLSATSMADKVVKQAKECLSLLPSSAAVQEQLAGIAAAERLQQLGLDLPPLQLQQLREQAARGGAQLVADHPHLAAADSGKLMQVAEALGVAQQQQPLLLRAAEAAHAGGDVARARSLLLLLADQRYKPAWQLAAAVAAERGCRGADRQSLLVFALASAPAEQLLSLLERWRATDHGWELAPVAEPGGSGSEPSSLQEQQRRQQLWLAQRLKQHSLALAGVAAVDGDDVAALGCLLALGHRGLALWERLLQDQQPPMDPLRHRRALLLGLTAGALLALQPAEDEAADAEAAAAAAAARLAAAPAELLRLMRQQQQQQQQQGAIRRQAGLGSGEQQPPSDAGSDAGDAQSGSETSATPPHQGRASSSTVSPAARAAAAAAAAAERFHGRLLSSAAAEHLQQLVPGLNAAAALSGDTASRRRLVLQLAAAAGTPAALRAGPGSGSGVPPSPGRLLSPSRKTAVDVAGSSPSHDGSAVRRTPSRKKSEAAGAGSNAEAAATAAVEGSAAASEPAGGWAGRSLNAGAAAETLQRALGLAVECEVPAWQVHLAFTEALLLHNQRFQDQQEAAAAQQLLEASLAALMGGQQPAAALLAVLLRGVWRAASSRNPQHLCLCLQLAHRLAEALAVITTGSAAEQQWRQVAAALAACHGAAGQLLQAAPGMDTKLFVQPVVQLLAATLCQSTDDGPASAPDQPPIAPEALNWQLLGHVGSGNAAQLAGGLGVLEQQHAALETARAGSAAQAAAYPATPSTVFLALFCSSLDRRRHAARGGLDAAAPDVQQCLACLKRMSRAHVAAAAAFAAAGAPCPLPLPCDSEQPVAADLAETQQAELLAAALALLDSQGEQASAAAVHLQPEIRQLQERHALLAAYASIAAACSAGGSGHVAAARQAATSLQQAALVATGDGAGGSGLGLELQGCLQQLLTSGCPAPAVLRVAAVLQVLQQAPEQAPLAADALLGQPTAAAAAQEAVAAAAESAVAAALAAMSGQTAEQQLSPGDAVQNLYALLRSLHSAEGGKGSAAGAAAEAEANAVAALRLLVWQQLQQEAASYDGSGGAAASEAHVQVLELLGSVGSCSMWPGWSPPALPLAAGPAGGDADGEGGYNHRQVLLFTRTAAALAVEWPAAVQRGRLAATDFAGVAAAEGALLRLAAAAEEAAQLRLLLRLLSEVLGEAFLAAADAEAAAAAAGQGRQAGEGGTGAQPAHDGLAPLHRVWSTCLRMLLPLGDLPGVLAALDAHTNQRQERASGRAPAAVVGAEEAAALLEAADACQGAAAAAAVAMLLPYPRLRSAHWELVLQACSGGGSSAADLAAACPCLATLLLLLVQRQPTLLVELAGGGMRQRQLCQHLVAAALLQQQREPSFTQPLGGGALTLRMAVAAALTAELVTMRQYTAAGWVAMQACGTPRLLRVLDSGTHVAQQLLRGCAAGSAAARAARAAAGGLAAGGGGGAVPVPCTATALLRALPEQCAQALDQLASDLQLGPARP